MNNSIFKAKACEFNGIPGYMMRQYIDGELVCEQFVSEAAIPLLEKEFKISVEIE